MSELRDWLRKNKLEQYADAFEANDIDLDILSELTEHDLEKLGVSLGVDYSSTHSSVRTWIIFRLRRTSFKAPPQRTLNTNGIFMRLNRKRTVSSVLRPDLCGSATAIGI